IQMVRFVRRRELIRGAIADVLAQVPVATAERVITPAADVALVGALRIAVVEARRAHDLEESPSRFAIIAVGRLGGAELSYASDADVLFVHDPHPGVDPQVAERWATAVAAQVVGLLGGGGSEPALPVDAALRPEGRNGPMVRTLASYAEYYERWAL